MHTLSAADAGHDARRLGRVQRLAESDGAGNRAGAPAHGRDDMARRRARGGCRVAAWRRHHGFQRRCRLCAAARTTPHRRKAMGQMSAQSNLQGSLDRRAVVARLLAGRKDLLVVTGLGSSSFDAMAAGDHDQNFYLWGAMGSAAMVGLGLATAKPKNSVLVLTGDGEMLMGFGSLATIA